MPMPQTMADRVPVEDAIALIRSTVMPVGQEWIEVNAAALGRITAGPVLAADDNPRFDASAMDGFALSSSETRTADPEQPVMLRLAAAIPAGAPAGQIAAGTVAPISTGAPVPAGADAILVRERAELAGDRIVIRLPVAAGLNVRPMGEDARRGAEVLEEGTRLTPDAIGALLSYGVTRISVWRRPQAVILTTGSEVGDGGLPGSTGVLDSNGPMIEAACVAMGIECHRIGPVRDDAELLREVFGREIESSADLVMTTGGVSVGDYDLVRGMLESAGAKVLFHGVAMRPGKPMLFARLRDGRPFFGLPGNPVAALVGFRFFVVEALRAMLGLASEQGISIEPPIPPRPGTTVFLRAVRSSEWPVRVTILSDQRSHVLGSVLRSDCWVRLEPLQRVVGGATVYEKLATLERSKPATHPVHGEGLA